MKHKEIEGQIMAKQTKPQKQASPAQEAGKQTAATVVAPHRGRCERPAPARHAGRAVPARLLAEKAAADPQRLPGFESPIQPEDLAGLACEEAALSRIVMHDRADDRWTLRHGPFDEDEFPACGDHDWTLLVQDVDKWDADVAAIC